MFVKPQNIVSNNVDIVITDPEILLRVKRNGFTKLIEIAVDILNIFNIPISAQIQGKIFTQF